MDKMAILAAPTTEPSVALRQGHYLLSTFGPLVQLAPRFQKALSSVSYHLVVQSYIVASVVVTSLLEAARFILVNLFCLTKVLALYSAALAKIVSQRLWSSKPCRRLRKKLEYEFFVLVLGPSGNALFLMIFWPGWLFALGVTWALWTWTG